MKVLIADDEGPATRKTADYLTDRGFDTRVVANGQEALNVIHDWRPRFVVIDLMLTGIKALDLIRQTKSDPNLKDHNMQYIVASGHNSEFNVRQALTAGARDYLVKPYKKEDLLNRLVFHSRKVRHIKDFKNQDLAQVDEASLMLYLTDLILKQALKPAALPVNLYNLTRMASMKLSGVRCNIVNVFDYRVGYVVASNDDPKAVGIKLDLNKYPEITNAVNSMQLIAIEDIDKHKDLAAIRDNLKNISFHSMIVCPLTWRGKPFGVFSLRMPKHKKVVSDNEIRFVEIVSQVVSLLLNREDFSKGGQFWRKSA